MLSCKPKQTFTDTKFTNINHSNYDGFIFLSLNNKNLTDNAIICGKVLGCTYKENAANTLVRGYDEKSRMVDSVFIDQNGNYKLKITAGTYKLKAIHISNGIIETTYLDYNPQDSTKVDLYLSGLPDLKD